MAVPTKLTGKASSNKIIIVSKEGNIQSTCPIVSLNWLDDCLKKNKVVESFEQYGFLFKDKKFFVFDSEDNEIFIHNTQEAILK